MAASPAGLERCQTLAAAVGGNASLLRCRTGPQSRESEVSRIAGSRSLRPEPEAGPLAAAGGAEERRVLKRQKVTREASLVVSQGAAVAQGLCRSGVVARAVASWPPPSGSGGLLGVGASGAPSGPKAVPTAKLRGTRGAAF